MPTVRIVFSRSDTSRWNRLWPMSTSMAGTGSRTALLEPHRRVEGDPAGHPAQRGQNRAGDQDDEQDVADRGRRVEAERRRDVEPPPVQQVGGDGAVRQERDLARVVARERPE